MYNDTILIKYFLYNRNTTSDDNVHNYFMHKYDIVFTEYINVCVSKVEQKEICIRIKTLEAYYVEML